MSKNACAYYIRLLLFFLLFALILTFASLGILQSRKHISVGSASKAEQAPICFVLDPGHGGEDGGATANGILEKDINLSVSEKAAAFLTLTPYSVHMTRTDDRLLYEAGEENRKKYHDLVHRAEFASSFERAVFISIHQNKFEIPKYRGLQVYYSPNNALSCTLAVCIQTNMRSLLDPTNKREVKKADHRIRVLASLHMPAVLVECGFLSNPEEAELLKTDAYQKKLAFVLFLSTVQFVRENGENIS